MSPRNRFVFWSIFLFVFSPAVWGLVQEEMAANRAAKARLIRFSMDAGELLSALEQTLKLEYVVLNEKGEEAGRGTVGGEEVKLKEGTYALRIILAPQPLETKAQVKSGGRAVGVLKKEAGSWKLGC